MVVAMDSYQVSAFLLVRITFAWGFASNSSRQNATHGQSVVAAYPSSGERHAPGVPPAAEIQWGRCSGWVSSSVKW